MPYHEVEMLPSVGKFFHWLLCWLIQRNPDQVWNQLFDIRLCPQSWPISVVCCESLRVSFLGLWACLACLDVRFSFHQSRCEKRQGWQIRAQTSRLRRGSYLLVNICWKPKGQCKRLRSTNATNWPFRRTNAPQVCGTNCWVNQALKVRLTGWGKTSKESFSWNTFLLGKSCELCSQSFFLLQFLCSLPLGSAWVSPYVRIW